MSFAKKYPELDYFNALACLLVVFIHVVSLGISKANPTSWQAAMIFFPWKLSAFVVPAFLFSGAIKMSLMFSGQFDIGEYGRYLGNRFTKIYIPYVIWNIIYYIAFLKIGYVNGSVRELISYLIIGNLSSPFYYIVIVMQFYLLYPFWWWLTKKLPNYIAISCSVIIMLLSLQLNSVLQIVQVSFSYLDRIFTSYIVFWIFGLYTGKHYDEIRTTLKKQRFGIVLSAFFVFVLTLLAFLQYSSSKYLLNMEPYKIFSDLLSIFVFWHISINIEDAGLTVSKILGFVHKTSFFVYLSHCLFLTLGTHFLQVYGITKLWLLLLCRFFICYTFPFGAYLVWEQVKRCWVIRHFERNNGNCN